MRTSQVEGREPSPDTEEEEADEEEEERDAAPAGRAAAPAARLAGQSNGAGAACLSVPCCAASTADTKSICLNARGHCKSSSGY